MDITVDKEGRASIVNMNGNFDIASSAPFDEQHSIHGRHNDQGQHR